jgi:hypothetical protein
MQQMANTAIGTNRFMKMLLQVYGNKGIIFYQYLKLFMLLMYFIAKIIIVIDLFCLPAFAGTQKRKAFLVLFRDLCDLMCVVT